MNTQLLILASVLCSAGLASGLQYRFPAVNLETREDSICPNDDLVSARMDITSNVSLILQEIVAGFNQTIEEIDQNDTTTHTVPECGGSGWRRVAFLNMTDPNQQCPNSWREYAQDSIRACGRQESTIASCSSVEYSPDGLEYTHICGRIIGYQFASPDGYSASTRFITLTPDNEINEPYVDGVSVTYGSPPARHHIWTLYGAVLKYWCCNDDTGHDLPPNFVEQNYFCDTGNPTLRFDYDWAGTFFTASPLWDNPTCCCAPQFGPWFNTTLRAPTTEDIEIRICGDEATSNEDTPLELIEIYVM